MKSYSGIVSKKRHKKILEKAKGFYGRSKNCYRLAKNRVEKGMQYSYRDKKAKKRDFRSLFIIRINAALRENGYKYSQFMHQLKEQNILLNRKMLAHMAWHKREEFNRLCANA